MITSSENDASASQARAQRAMASLEDVHERLDDFVRGKAEAPAWDALMAQFHGALAQLQQGADLLGHLPGGS